MALEAFKIVTIFSTDSSAPSCDPKVQLALDALMLSQAAKLLRGVTVQRITFVEVTKAAVLAALAAPRAVAMPLVEAYLARRAIDYLLGFHLTPVLWRKLPAAKSAGAPLHSAK